MRDLICQSNRTFKYFVETTSCVYVVVNFLSQLVFIFVLFWGMVMYANEFETKEKQKLTKIKKLTATCILKQLFFSISVNSGFGNIYIFTSISKNNCQL